MLYETIESQENIQLEKARQDDVSDPESLELVEIKPLQTNASDSSGDENASDTDDSDKTGTSVESSR